MIPVIEWLQTSEDELRKAEPKGWQPDLLGQCREWIRRWPDLWSHVILSGVALNVSGTWHSRCLQMVVTDCDDRGSHAAARTNEVLVYRRVYPLAVLPDLLEGIAHRGCIHEQISPVAGAALHVHVGDGVPYHFDRGGEEQPQFERTSTPLDQWRRFNLEWEAHATLEKLFDHRSHWARWLESANEAFEALGHGPIARAAKELGVIRHGDRLNWDQKPFGRLVIPLPVKLEAVKQNPDRTGVLVTVQAGHFVKPADLEVVLERTAGGTKPQRAIVQDVGRMVVELQTEAAQTEAMSLLVFCGQRVQRQRVDLWPRLPMSHRLAAILHVEGKATLLADGLLPAAWDRPNSEAFERAVSHFLALIGFSPVWWGPPNYSKLATPQDQVDVLAFNSDETLALLVECSTQPIKGDKVRWLVTRAKRLEAAFNDDLGNEPPAVRALLAFPVERRVVPLTISEPAEKEGVALLTGDVMEKVLSMLKAGTPHRELVRALPEPLGRGFEGLLPVRLFASALE